MAFVNTNINRVTAKAPIPDPGVSITSSTNATPHHLYANVGSKSGARFGNFVAIMSAIPMISTITPKSSGKAVCVSKANAIINIPWIALA